MAEQSADAAGDEPAVSFEQARDELAEVVRALETGGATLEESLALWERGEQLAQTCQQWLDGARARLEAVRANAGAAEDE
ncbi:MAG TPA: exodeoxyribonuclease VII small subunit [Candidatus Nanopelagicales bacterium]|jgi:exodeoxyribonuclease VII small subunit|nr:exodeoxyribonuclease VII small subunit [Candidatus Nanopelagicales bacterium]